MILDEIYEAIRKHRAKPYNEGFCPFPVVINRIKLNGRHDWCRLIFPEVNDNKTDYEYYGYACPCWSLDEGYVKSEMRRLFP